MATTPTRTVSALLPPTPTVKENETTTTAVPEEKTEVNDKLEQLKKTLVAKGVEDKEILEQIQALETASSKEGAQPSITHKTLNQLQKAEKQFSTATAQLKELDAQWVKWSKYMKDKIQEQSGLYKEKRKAMVSRRDELKQRLAALRTEMQQAALQKAESKEDDFVAPPVVDFDMELEMILSSDDEDKKRQAETTMVQSSPAKVPKKE